MKCRHYRAQDKTPLLPGRPGEFITREHTLPHAGVLPARTVVRSSTKLNEPNRYQGLRLPGNVANIATARITVSLRFSCFRGNV